MADGIDRDAIRGDIEKLLRQGWPEGVVMGFVLAKAKDTQWSDFRRMVDEIGEQAHGGDPAKKARVERFNDMLIAELKEQQER